MRKLLAATNLSRAAPVLWALALVTLPVTTFRYLPGPLGLAQIKPLAMLPLALLLPVLALQFWRRRSLPLPVNIRPLLAFLLFAAIASLVGLLYAPIPLRGAEVDGRILRGWFSLAVGLAFFLSAFWMNRSRRDLQYSLKWLYVGLALTILWSFVQALAIHTELIPAEPIDAIQLFLAEHPLFPERVSGFAYEPSWLSDQLVGLYMPWLFAAVLMNQSLVKRRWLEPLLLALAAVVLLLTYSRGGILIAGLCAALTLLFTGRAALQRLLRWWRAPFRTKRAPELALRLVLALALLAGALGAAAFLARYDYFSGLWTFLGSGSLVRYIIDNSAGPRLVYALAGYRVFETAPLTGVGLGASGLYLLPHYADWSFELPEIARQLSPDSYLIPNTKNLYSRLLAETGLPGFWFFLVFTLSFLALLRRMWLGNSAFHRFVAAAGLFAWLATMLRNMTQDSFTFPIMWVIFGMLAGMYPAYAEESKKLYE